MDWSKLPKPEREPTEADFNAMHDKVKDWIDGSPDGICAICGDKIARNVHLIVVNPLGQQCAVHKQCAGDGPTWSDEATAKIDAYMKKHGEG